MQRFNILVLGAAYGLVPSLRMLSAGHHVTVVCKPEEQAELIRDGAKIVFHRDTENERHISAPAQKGAAAAGTLGLADPNVDASGFDLVFLAMSEPHYTHPAVGGLLKRIAAARTPVISLMNMVPPPFLSRLCPEIDLTKMAPAYAAWDVWQHFDPQTMSAASPDAQAVRLDPAVPNELTVTLGSNFKVAPFARKADQAMLDQICTDVAADRPNGAPLTVRILAHDALQVPLAKWPMLIAGNCRCINPDRSLRPIRDAVHSDLAVSEKLYDEVLGIVSRVSRSETGFVPFRNYARAAKGLSRPSSFGRAVAAGATAVERVDKMVQLAGHSVGIQIDILDQMVADIDEIIGLDKPDAA